MSAKYGRLTTLSYWNTAPRCETGEIIVGQELWQELENLCEDFHNDRYFYDTDDPDALEN